MLSLRCDDFACVGSNLLILIVDSRFSHDNGSLTLATSARCCRGVNKPRQHPIFDGKNELLSQPTRTIIHCAKELPT